MSERIYEALANDEPIPWGSKLPDPKPPARVKANSDDWQRLRAEKLGPCRVGEPTPGACVAGVSLHHLVPRSLRGDDLAANLVPLCGDGTRGCHGLIEARDPWACSLLGRRLSDAELEYVLEKKGADFLARYYGVRSAA